MKLTQGTGRGTCWWNKIFYFFGFLFLVNTIKYSLLGINNILNNVFFYFNSIFFFLDELLIIILIYNFMKLIIFNSIIELIWPTNYFNKKHNINFSLIKFRSFTEVLLKLRLINKKKSVFFKYLLKYFFLKKKKIK